MRTNKDIMRFTSLAALLLAGSCAAPSGDGPTPGNFSDPVANHPIAIEPSYRALKLPFSATDAGLMPDDAARFNDFVSKYLAGGNGAISITAPPGGEAAISYFGERLASMGVPRNHILVGTRQQGDTDARVELGYMAYSAHVENCTNDWPTDWGDTWDNAPAPNFGCAVQKNMAAMLADPRDMTEPRPMEAPDAARRATVMGHYDKGEVTQADKHSVDKPVEQSGMSSQVQ
jgi:pilus assembly protein CpaD